MYNKEREKEMGEELIENISNDKALKLVAELLNLPLNDINIFRFI